MKKHFFAGFIAILCTMIPSIALSQNFIFSRCANACNFQSITFDSTKGEVEIIVTDKEAPKISWDSISVYFVKETHSNSEKLAASHGIEKHGIYFSWQYNKNGSQRADVTIEGPTTVSVQKEGTHTFKLKLSSEQIAFLKNFDALPGGATSVVTLRRA